MQRLHPLQDHMDRVREVDGRGKIAKLFVAVMQFAVSLSDLDVPLFCEPL